MKIELLADSCCDVTPAIKKLLDVDIVSLTINVNDAQFVDDDALSQTELLDAMKADKKAPSTACPSPEAYAERMRACEACFVVTLSSKLSGSYNAAVVGRDMVLEEFPEKKIHVVDSQSAAACELLLARVLRDRIDAGLDFDTIVQEIEEYRDSITTLFVLENLDNLIKNGRISKFAGFMGTMLNLRPIMGTDGTGAIIPVEKVRGTATAMQRMAEMIEERTKDVAKESRILVITYCNCLQRAQALKDRLAENCQAFKEIILLPTRGISTVYAYDGGIVLAY